MTFTVLLFFLTPLPIVWTKPLDATFQLEMPNA